MKTLQEYIQQRKEVLTHLLKRHALEVDKHRLDEVQQLEDFLKKETLQQCKTRIVDIKDSKVIDKLIEAAERIKDWAKIVDTRENEIKECDNCKGIKLSEDSEGNRRATYDANFQSWKENPKKSLLDVSTLEVGDWLKKAQYSYYVYLIWNWEITVIPESQTEKHGFKVTDEELIKDWWKLKETK